MLQLSAYESLNYPNHKPPRNTKVIDMAKHHVLNTNFTLHIAVMWRLKWVTMTLLWYYVPFVKNCQLRCFVVVLWRVTQKLVRVTSQLSYQVTVYWESQRCKLTVSHFANLCDYDTCDHLRRDSDVISISF